MAKGVAPRVAPLLLLFAAAAEAGRKKEVVEKPLPSVSMQMLDLTLSPLKKLAAAYSELPVAEHMTLPMFAGTCVLSLFLLWVISRILTEILGYHIFNPPNFFGPPLRKFGQVRFP